MQALLDLLDNLCQMCDIGCHYRHHVSASEDCRTRHYDICCCL